MQAIHGIVSAYFQKDQFIGYEPDGSAAMAKDFIGQAEQTLQKMNYGNHGISIKELKENLINGSID